jgi:hypothetical protein
MVPTAPSPARRRIPVLALAGIACLAATAVAAEGGAKPRWELKLTHGPLKSVTVTEASGAQASYHYLTMKVENGTAHPRPWRPHVVGTTDTPRPAYVAGGFPLALERIRRAERDESLQALDASQFGDDKKERKVGVGETLNLVAIFGPLDPLYDRFTVEIQGLVNPVVTLKVLKYGDRQVVLDDAYADRNRKVMDELKKEAAAGNAALPTPTEEYHEVVERRAFAIEYARAGDEYHATENPIEFVREGWKLLGEPKFIRSIGGTGSK